jgi:two-component system LytT family response regulator
MSIRTLLVDDEPLALAGLRMDLQEHSDVEIVRECLDGQEAVLALRELQPQLIFLDVQMPGLDGFSVLDRIEPRQRPLVVFVTAFEDYAVRAFRQHALDYLLKPVEPQLLAGTLGRVRDQMRCGCCPLEQLERLRAAAPRASAPEYLHRLTVQEGRRAYFIPVAEIDYLVAADNYVRVHTGGRRYLIRSPLKELEQQLDPRRFVRIHRSTIVNIERLNYIYPHFKGDYMAALTDGTELRVSRVYRDRLFA